MVIFSPSRAKVECRHPGIFHGIFGDNGLLGLGIVSWKHLLGVGRRLGNGECENAVIRRLGTEMSKIG